MTIVNIKQLSISDQHFCDASITLKEIEEAIKSLKDNKSPGTDGISSELYKLFSHVIAPFLLKEYKEDRTSNNIMPRPNNPYSKIE